MPQTVEPIALYAFGAFMTLLMALLGFFMNATRASMAAAQKDIKDSMSTIVENLRALNNAVLADYIERKDVDSMLATLRAEIAEHGEATAKTIRALGENLHRFEVGLAAKGVVLPPKGADA